MLSTRELVSWMLEKRPCVKLTVRNFDKLILRAWFMVLVGVIFTTETLVCLFYVLF